MKKMMRKRMRVVYKKVSLILCKTDIRVKLLIVFYYIKEENNEKKLFLQNRGKIIHHLLFSEGKGKLLLFLTI